MLNFEILEELSLQTVRRHIFGLWECQFELVVQKTVERGQPLQPVHNNNFPVLVLRDIKDRQRDAHGAGFDESGLLFHGPNKRALEVWIQLVTILVDPSDDLSGRPHVAPVWFVVDDNGTIVFNTGAETVKGRTLRRTGCAAMTVQDDQPPFSFVTVEGPVAISEDLDEVRTWAARIGGRYIGADRAEEYGERNGVAGELLVRLTATKIISARDLAD